MEVYLMCPVGGCDVGEQVSGEDPDASQSQLWGHFVAGHPDYQPEMLLAEAFAVDGDGRELDAAELQNYIDTDN